jgi:hypothetical protein
MPPRKRTTAAPASADYGRFEGAFQTRVQELGCDARVVSRGANYVTFEVTKRLKSGGLSRQTYMFQDPPDEEAFAAHLAAHAVAKLLRLLA